MRWNVLDLSLRTAIWKLRSRRIFLLDVDAASVSQIVYTLLDNAAKYSDPGSKIRLSASVTSRSKVRIVVEDQGRGIPKVDRDRVFDKFFRLGEQDVHRTAGGLGLGLTIARGMIESQGGRHLDRGRQFGFRDSRRLRASHGIRRTRTNSEKIGFRHDR